MPNTRLTEGPTAAGSRRRAAAVPVALALTGVLLSATIAASALVSRTPATGAPEPLGSYHSPTADDGFVADGQTLSPFDDELPALARLDPALLSAVQEAARAAREDGYDFYIQSGWRSAAFQQQLLDEAVQQYGSLAEARSLVSTPETSHHVSGTAVDIGPTDAMSWLQQHGADFSLCQTYTNEMWHWELAPSDGQCPDQLADASAG